MPEAFKNIIDYVWSHPEPFSERQLCRVDSLVLSQLSYFQLPSAAVAAWGWQGIPIHDLWRSDWLDEMTDHKQVAPVKGGISIDGFAGQQVRVFSIDGRQIDAFVASEGHTLSLTPGIYIVTVNGRGYKVSVK